MKDKIFIDHFNNTDVKAADILRSQKIARDCLEHMNTFIKPGMDHKTIHEECERYMIEKGAESFWTHDDGALILFSDLTTYSAHLSPASLYDGKTVGENDLITIDVSPTISTGWGDMARSFIMENGKIIPWQESSNQEIRESMEMEMKLHELFLEWVKEDTTFSDLHRLTNDYLNKHGYINLDYHGNFGHSIENRSSDRVTIIEGVDIVISKYDKPITFEPHICKINGSYGVKHENIYFYHDGKMEDIL